MMESQSRFELQKELTCAAGFDANRTYHALYQHLGYRKAIAQQILQEINEDKLKDLFEMYQRINHEIKLIIGIN